MNRLIFGLALALAVAAPSSAVHAQSQDAAPSFEVASVKRSDPNAGTSPIGPIPRIMPPLGGRFTAANVPLRLLVRMAYELPDFRIVGGPSWLSSERFDITAKAEDGFSGNFRDIFPLVRTLLEDRFKLKTHRETRELPIYALVVARDDGRLGAKLKASSSECGDVYAEAQKRIEEAFKGGGAAGLAALAPKPGQTVRCSIGPGTAAPGAIGLKADGLPMSILAQLLTELTGRVVQDQTGLSGLYDWDLQVSIETMLQMAAATGVNIPPGALANLPSTGPSLMTTLQEDLGLELESVRGPVEVLVIDSAELPAAD